MTNQDPEPNLGVWRKYGKTFMTGLWAIASVVIPLYSGDKHIDPKEGVIIAITVGNVLLVYFIPMKTSFRGAKSFINAVLASLAVLQTFVLNGADIEALDWNDWAMVIAAGLAVLGVTVAPAASVQQPDPVIVPTGLTTG
jgi:hypothetical protein